MQITLSLTRNVAMGTPDDVNVTVDGLTASAAEMPFAQRLVEKVCEFARSQNTGDKEGK
jgi:hypothetical protein